MFKQKPESSSAPPPSDEHRVSAMARSYGDLEKSTQYLMPILIVGVVAAWWLGFSADAAAKVLLWVMASLVAGGAVGFLFGIPKSASPGSTPADTTKDTKDPKDTGHAEDAKGTKDTVDTEDKRSVPGNDGRGARPNTNLEEVSDWLTKIIVGLGLVHLKDISAYVSKISWTVAASLTSQPVPTPGEMSVAMALVVGFVVLGFLFGYLYTRLFLQGAFQRSDFDTFTRYLHGLQGTFQRSDIDMYPSYIKATQQIFDRTESGTEASLKKPVLPTKEDLKSAQKVLNVAPADPQVALAPLRSLAAEYEQLRRIESYGPERTKKMWEIVQKMKSFGLVATQFLPQLTQSFSPGDRLAAIVGLQMQFDPAYINWLADRLVQEPAFPGYQAASAFLARLPLVGRGEAEEIKNAVRNAIQRRRDAGIPPEPSLDELCNKILTVAE